MKQLVFILLCVVLFNSCKEKEAEPDYSTHVTGSYVGVAIRAEGQMVELPYNGVRVSMFVTRIKPNEVNFRSNMTIPNESPVTLNLDCKVNYTSSRITLIEPSTNLDIAWLEDGYLVQKINGQDIYIYAKK